MRTDLTRRTSYYLEPGYIFCATEPATVHAVLGACVAVCLWDKRLCFGGINHFLFPEIRERERATAKFGNAATLELVRLMERAGSKRDDLLAQILGGASPLAASGHTVGAKNIEAARAILRQKRLRICSEDVGGHMGRKVVFDSLTGHVAVLKVFELRQEDWLIDSA